MMMSDMSFSRFILLTMAAKGSAMPLGSKYSPDTRLGGGARGAGGRGGRGGHQANGRRAERDGQESEVIKTKRVRGRLGKADR